MTHNFELFHRDPRTANLANDGQARLVPSDDPVKTEDMLRHELEHFVCEGQYAKGIQRILDSFLANLGGNAQRAAWVSGFYGSGKSHLLKMLCHLWANTTFADGSTARELAPDLTADIKASLAELDTAGRQHGGGVFSVSGSMPEGRVESARLTVLSIIFRACGLPQAYHQAKFCLYLKNRGYFDSVKSAVEKEGKEFHRELAELYASPIIRKALLANDPGLGDEREVGALIREQFPQTSDIETNEFIRIAKEVLSIQGGGAIPLTAIVLDEVQHYVGSSEERSRSVTELTESVLKQMDSRVLIIAAGQNALSSDTPQFAWLRDRFTIPVELSDADVETVTRKVLLAKKPEALPLLQNEISRHSGEIERQLSGTRIAPNSADQNFLVSDYPILPVRRRFWERALRSTDPTGSSSLLRTQLRITHEALQSVADEKIAHVVPGDFMFFQQQSGLVQQDVLPREISDRILSVKNGSPDGELAARACGLVFLIRRLPRESGADAGLRANTDTLADLLVRDLEAGGTNIRKNLPAILENLVEKDVLLFDGSEYNLQTRESADWEEKYRQEIKKIRQDPTAVLQERKIRLQEAVQKQLRALNRNHGTSKTPREVDFHFGNDNPPPAPSKVIIWIRDGWDSKADAVLASARQAGDSDSALHVFLPKADENHLKNFILQHRAAQAVLSLKGVTTTPEADEAKGVMNNRALEAERGLTRIIERVLEAAKVYKGGGAEMHDLALRDKVQAALDDAFTRLYPQFASADHKGWHLVGERARKGSDSPFELIGFQEATTKHRVCAEILAHLQGEKEGRHLRAHFKSAPFGWPQDAIDAALTCLHAEGEIIAKDQQNGENVAPRQLDTTRIPRCSFRTEQVSIKSTERIAIKGLIQSAGLSVKPKDDLNLKAAEFLAHLSTLAASAGGDAPLPAPPSTAHLEALRSESGNTRLQKILTQKDALAAQAKDWAAKKDLTHARLPGWNRLQDLLSHVAGASSPEAKTDQLVSSQDGPATDPATAIITSATAIRDSRLLLETPDPCPPLIRKLSELLRADLAQKRQTYATERENQLTRLQNSPTWQELPPEKQKSLYQNAQAHPEPASHSIETEGELLHALREQPLRYFADRTAALAAHTDSLLKEAAIALQPKAKHLTLPATIITSEAELEQWLNQTRARIAGELKNNPVSL